MAGGEQDMKTLISLNHVILARQGWINEFGMELDSKPSHPTFLGVKLHSKRPLESADVWQYFVEFEFGSRRTERFYGRKATALWAAWCAKTFKAETKHERTNKQLTLDL